MSASLVAKLQLDIAGYQAALAKSNADTERWKEKSKRSVDSVGAAHKKLSGASLVDSRLNLQLIHAKISGNEKEISQIEQRIRLLQQVRQIQQQTGVSQREAYMLSQKLGTGSAAKGGGGGSRFALGNASYQVQDIAVQLQMGTKASVILAQQGSQLLSTFGVGGALAGGALAVGGALWTMGEKSHESFVQMKEDAKAFNAVFQGMLIDSSPDKLAANIQAIQSNNAASKDKWRELQTGGGMIGALVNQLVGGESVNKQIQESARLQYEAGDKRGQLVEATLQTSEKELEILALRVKGENDLADSKERELRLAIQMAHIDALPIPKYAKDQLKNDARQTDEQKFAIKEAEEAAKKKEADQKKLAAAEEKLNDAKEQSLEEQMTIEERILDLRDKIAKVAPDAANDPLAQVEAETKKVEMQIELNRLIEEQARLEQQATKEAEREAKAIRKKAEEERKATAEKKKQRDAGREESTMSMEVLRLRANGRDKQANALEKQNRIEAEAERLRQLGASPEYAMQQAKERARLEDKLENRRSGKPGHIGGVRGEGKKMGSAGGGGIDGFNRMQEKEYESTGPARPGYQRGRPRPLFESDSLSGRGQRNGRMMGMDQGSLSDRAAQAAGKQDAKTSGASTTDILSKMLAAAETLNAGLLAA